MKVFVTWSGERAKTIAKALREGLPNVIQTVEPWMSEEDIRAGVRWQIELNQQLDQTDFGIVVLTPESLSVPWIHYEAGALAKKVDIGAVCPYLVDISEKVMVTGPLAQFQSKLAIESETFDLIKAINQHMEGREKLDDTRLTNAFTKLFWPPLNEVISSLPTAKPAPVKRSSDDLLKEILERVRSIERRFIDETSDLTAAALLSQTSLSPAAERALGITPMENLIHSIIDDKIQKKHLEKLLEKSRQDIESLKLLPGSEVAAKKNSGK